MALERGDVAELSPGGPDEGPSAAQGLPPGVVFLSGSRVCAGSVIMSVEGGEGKKGGSRGEQNCSAIPQMNVVEPVSQGRYSHLKVLVDEF